MIPTMFFALSVFLATNAYAEIYKYQDQQGKWHFTDKKPETSQTVNLESLTIDSKPTKNTRPFVEVKSLGNLRQYHAHNPYHAPVQAFFRFEDAAEKRISKLLAPLTSEIMAESPLSEPKWQFHFRYVLGAPEATPAVDVILPPFSGSKPLKISQGFRGRFSHFREPSLHAVDISMPVGTHITAVKSGIVINTKDDYHTAGITSGFFLDKANYVAILHEDGSYAYYGHLLLGGVRVKPGQSVVAGELIGLSGNTGYSTGPHLHFVVRHNADGKRKSLPFKFRQPEKQAVSPKQGEWLLPMSR